MAKKKNSTDENQEYSDEQLLRALYGEVLAQHELTKSHVGVLHFGQISTNITIQFRPDKDEYILYDTKTKMSIVIDSSTAKIIADLIILNNQNVSKYSKDTNQPSAFERSYASLEILKNRIALLLKSQLENTRKKSEADVYIAIPQKDTDLFQVENLQNTVGDLMEALGYELETKEEPVHGSFYQRLKFLLKEPKTQEEIAMAFNMVKIAAKTKYVGNPTADETEKIANATAKLIEAASKFDSVVIRAERILLVKGEINGKTMLKVQTLSPTLMQLLDEQPPLMDRPELMLQLVSDAKEKPKALEGGEAPAISGTQNKI